MTESLNMPSQTAPKKNLKSLLFKIAWPVAKVPLAWAHRKYTKGETHFIMKKLTGGDNRQVSILPDDKWLGGYVLQEYKQNAAFKKALHNIANPALTLAAGGIAIIAGLGIAAVAAPLVGAAVLMGTMAFAVGSAGLGVQLAGNIKGALADFKKHTLPEFQKNIAIAYAKHKGSEFKDKWKSDFQSSLNKVRGKDSAPKQAPAADAPKPQKVRTQLRGAFSLAKKALLKKRQTPAKPASKPPRRPK